MAIDSKDARMIRSLIPLATLSASRFEKLCQACRVEDAPRGAVLFPQGDGKNTFVYLLGGKVALQAGGVEMEIIEAGSETARFALAHQIPRKVSAIARNKVRFVRIDPQFLHAPDETSTPMSSYQVSDIPQESPNDWMTALLRLPLFQQLPAAHLQKLLMEVEEVRVKSGRRILVQGEPGDHYYIVKKGRCALSRKPSQHAKEIVIARLKACDTFGEDALISSEPSQVSATMLTDGELLRLDRARFLQSIKEPLLRSIDLNTPRQEPLANSTLLDVRPPEQFERKRLQGSINMPFFSLAMQLSKLDKNKHHIVICSDGKMSEMATFLLIKNGFNAVVLKDGLSKAPDQNLHTAARGKTSNVLVKPPGSDTLQNTARIQALEATRGQRSPLPRQAKKPIARAPDTPTKAIKEPAKAQKPQPPIDAQTTAFCRAETAEPTQELAVLRTRVGALEEQRQVLKDQIEQYRLKTAASLSAQQKQLDISVAERHSLNDQLTEKTEIIAELESTIGTLREANAKLEQQLIKTAKTPTTGTKETSGEPGVLPPDMAMTPR